MKSLMAQANWVVWRKDSERGKVPVNPYTGGNAMSNNPSTWSDYHTAQATARQYDGIGLMFYEGIGGIDIDGHNGDNALANEVLSLFANTYCEISPSGTGYHILFKVDTSRLPIEVKDGKKKIDPKYYVKNPKTNLNVISGVALTGSLPLQAICVHGQVRLWTVPMKSFIFSISICERSKLL